MEVRGRVHLLLILMVKVGFLCALTQLDSIWLPQLLTLAEEVIYIRQAQVMITRYYFLKNFY